MRRRSILAIIAVLCVTAHAPGANAAPPGWQLIGPPGGDVIAIAFAPDGSVFAGAGSGGLYRSTDAGVHWHRATEDLPLDTVVDIAVDPADPSRLFCIVYQAGIYRSTDAGAHWTKVLDVAEGTAVAIDPIDPSIVLAATLDGVMRSADGGDTWQSSIADEAYDVAFAPNGNTLWTATAVGIERSFDAGVTWTAKHAHPTDAFNVELLVGSGGTVFAGYERIVFGSAGISLSGGLLRTTDLGDHWGAIQTGLRPPAIVSLAMNPAQETTVVAGTYEDGAAISYDSGSHWMAVDRVKHAVTAIAFDPLKPEIVLEGTLYSAIRRSIDGGSTWRVSASGIDASVVTSMAPARDGRLYAATLFGAVERSARGTGSWAYAGLGGRDVEALVADPRAPSTVFAGAGADERSPAGAGVFASGDGGRHWSARSSGLADRDIICLALRPSSTRVRTLYAGTASGVYRSTDAGHHWAQSTAARAIGQVFALAVDPRWRSTLYASTDTGLWKSRDGAGRWSKLTSGPGFSYSLAIDPRRTATVYASGDGVYRSDDAGANWISVDPGTFADYVVTDPVRARTVYIHSGGDVLVSNDNGATWTSLGLLDDRGVLGLAIAHDGSKVFLTPYGGGVITRAL